MERSKLLELSSKHFACVYKLVFPNGKIYVGKSKDIGKRVDVYRRKTDGKWAEGASTALYGAIRFCGIDAVDCEILFKINGGVSGVDSEQDLDYALGIVEMRWIKELRSNDVEVGYNSTDGGEMFGVRNMERVKEVEVEKKRIVFKDIEVPRERQSAGIPVVGYDIEGRYIGEWASCASFSREVLGLKRAVDFGTWTKGFIVYEKREPVEEKVESYAEFIERTKAAEIEAKRVLEEKIGKVKTYREVRLRREVVFIGANGEEVCRYDNIRQAADETGFRYSSIYMCLKNGYGTVEGLRVFWSDEWDEKGTECFKTAIERKVARRRASKFGRVFQYDMAMNEIAAFDSISDAAEKTGFAYANISFAAQRKDGATCGSYQWRFEADRIPPKEENIETGIDEGQQTVLSDDEF